MCAITLKPIFTAKLYTVYISIQKILCKHDEFQTSPYFRVRSGINSWLKITVPIKIFDHVFFPKSVILSVVSNRSKSLASHLQ
jgi:hypothetical protein